MAEATTIDIEPLGNMLDDSDEVVRIFMGRGGPNTLLVNAETIDEPFALGMICVDLMKHGAMAFAQAKGMDAGEAFETIMAGLMAELQNPTDGEGEAN